jgi:hypothetical protein
MKKKKRSSLDRSSGHHACCEMHQSGIANLEAFKSRDFRGSAKESSTTLPSDPPS